jgi:tetratricopeptide (TPR) repeat protein
MLQQRYQIVERLGSAGAVTTYLAIDEQVPGNLQLKCVIHRYQLPPVPKDSYLWHQAALTAQIYYEISAQIDQIPSVYGYFAEEGAFYLVREFIIGSSLAAELAAAKPESETQVVMLLADLLEILHGLYNFNLLPKVILPSQILRRSLDRKLELAHFPILPSLEDYPVSHLPPLERCFQEIGILAIAAATGKLPDTIQPTDRSWSRGATQIHNRELIQIIDRLADPRHSDRVYTHPAAPWQEVVAIMSTIIERQKSTPMNTSAVNGDLRDRAGAINRYVELLTVQGNAAYELGDCQNALAAYEQAISLDDRCVEAYCGRGNVRRYLGDYEGSREDFELAVNLAPQYGIAYIGRGLASSLQHGFDAQTIADFRSGRSLLAQPQTAIDFVMRGTAGAQLGNPEAAIADYSTALRINPQSVIAYNNRGNLRRNLGDREGAIEDFTAVLTIDPTSAVAYNNRAIVYSDLERYAEAITDYTKAIELKPDFASAYNNRGNAYSDLGEYPQAVADYNRSLEIQPTFAIAYSNRGNVSRLQGNLEEAIEDYNRSIAIDPGLVIAYYNRAITRRQLGDHQGAIEDYSTTIELDPQHFYAYYHRANARQFLGDTRGAIADYTHVIRLNENYVAAHYNRAIARTRLKDFAGAMEDLERVIELDSDSSLGFYQRGWILSQSGQHRYAIEDYNRAIELAPFHLDAFYQRGMTHRELGDRVEAIADFDRVLEIDPDYAPAYYQRALTYTQIGDRAGAVADFDRAAKLYLEVGDHKSYQRILQLLDRLTSISNG